MSVKLLSDQHWTPGLDGRAQVSKWLHPPPTPPQEKNVLRRQCENPAKKLTTRRRQRCQESVWEYGPTRCQRFLCCSRVKVKLLTKHPPEFKSENSFQRSKTSVLQYMFLNPVWGPSRALSPVGFVIFLHFKKFKFESNVLLLFSKARNPTKKVLNGRWCLLSRSPCTRLSHSPSPSPCDSWLVRSLAGSRIDTKPRTRRSRRDPALDMFFPHLLRSGSSSTEAIVCFQVSECNGFGLSVFPFTLHHKYRHKIQGPLRNPSGSTSRSNPVSLIPLLMEEEEEHTLVMLQMPI